jgi:HK97 family phage prohead protease
MNHATRQAIADCSKALEDFLLPPPQLSSNRLAIRAMSKSIDELRAEIRSSAVNLSRKQLNAALADFNRELSASLADSLLPPLLEVKKSPQGAQITGYASTFGPPPDDQNEIIDAGAYTGTIMQHQRAGTMPVMLFGHDQNKPIGTWTSMSEDRHGLKVSGLILSSIRKGAETISLIKARSINGLSVGFRTKKDQRIAGIRHIQAVDLIEISCVSLPSAKGARLAITGEL